MVVKSSKTEHLGREIDRDAEKLQTQQGPARERPCECIRSALPAASVRGEPALVRMARGISQEELADRATLDRTYISSIEPRLRNLLLQNV